MREGERWPPLPRDCKPRELAAAAAKPGATSTPLPMLGDFFSRAAGNRKVEKVKQKQSKR